MTPRSASGVDQPLLDVRGLATEFMSRGETVEAVRGISFTVGRGQLVGLVGESGSGKSATVRSILGLLPAAGRVVAGEAFLLGRDLLRMSRRELRAIRGDRVGFVAQNPFGSLNPILPIHRQFHNVLRAHGADVGRRESRERAIEALQQVNIARPRAVVEGHAGALSGGMAQRVVIALALIMNPGLLIADEPTTALDVTVQRQLLDLIKELAEELETAVLLVTHDLGVVAQYFEHVLVMRHGEIVEAGLTHDVFTNPEHGYTRRLLESVPTAQRSPVDRPAKGTA